MDAGYPCGIITNQERYLRMSNPKGRPAPLQIYLKQKHGPMASYWTAQVRRSGRKPSLFENSHASRAIALSGAENWCNRLGHTYQIKEAK